MEEQKRIFGLRLSALVETLLFLLVALVWNLFTDAGNRFWDTEPHPFWIIIVLIASQYGTAEGVAAALAAILALLVGNLPEQRYGQDMHQYLFEIAINPVMWILAAVMLGELRVRHLREREELKEQVRTATARENKISDSYEWVRDLKQKMELRIAGQLRSSVDTYRAAKAVEKLNPQDVLAGVSGLISAVMNPEKFSVYLRDGKSVSATIMSGWTEEDNFSRQYDGGNRLFQEVIGNRRTICAVNDEHEQILGGEGVLAGPLLDAESGEVVGMLKVEKLGFTELNLSSIEAFRAICEWVGLAFVNAGKYQTAVESSVINPDHNLMTLGYFKRYTDYITALAKRLNFDVSMIVIKLVNADKLDAAMQHKVALELSRIVDKVLRTVDLAFDYQAEEGQFSIVMPATNKKGARIVQEKIEKDLTKNKAMNNAAFTFMVHGIHEK